MEKGAPMRPKIIYFLIAAVLCAGLLAGCAAWNLRNEPPGISLAAIRPLEMRGLENRFEVDLRVLNRSERPLTIQGIDCDLMLNNRNFAQGVGQPLKEIPAYGSDIVTLTVYSTVIDMARLVHHLIKTSKTRAPGEKWVYALTGNVQLEQSGLSGKIPFDVSGEMDVNDLLSIGQ
jgi:LEA14-like dessication related protein